MGEKTGIKNRLVVFCSVLVVSMLMPSATVFAEGWMTNPLNELKATKAAITYQVEAGQTFILGDYLRIATYDGYSVDGSVLNGIKYKSSNSKVAAVKGKMGQVTTKKAGTAKITATYKGKTFVCTLTVKKKGALKSTKTLKKILEAAKKLPSYYAKSGDPDAAVKIFRKNFSIVFRLADTFTQERCKSSVKKLLTKKGVLSVPTYRRCMRTLKSFDFYLECVDCEFDVASISVAAGSDTVTVTLASPVTFEQIIALQHNSTKGFETTKKALSFNEAQAVITSKGTYQYPLSVTAPGGKAESFSTTATFTTGSSEVIVKLSGHTIASGETVSTDLHEGTWGNNVTSPAA